MIIGNLTRNPELRTTATGQSVVSFGVATNRVWNKDGHRQEQAEFHNVVAWGKLAEICNQYLAKGRKVYVEGRLQTREWQGQDGVKRQRTEIIAEQMTMLDRAPQGTQGASAATPEAVAEPAPAPSGSGEDEVRLEDIPF